MARSLTPQGMETSLTQEKASNQTGQVVFHKHSYQYVYHSNPQKMEHILIKLNTTILVGYQWWPCGNFLKWGYPENHPNLTIFSIETHLFWDLPIVFRHPFSGHYTHLALTMSLLAWNSSERYPGHLLRTPGENQLWRLREQDIPPAYSLTVVSGRYFWVRSGS